MNTYKMKVLIIENEKPAADKLTNHIKRYDPDIEILGRLETVAQSIEWFRNTSNRADLCFVDIELSDGISFDIFNQVELNTPVIFTTAYDQYAIKAFEVNSVDYLLKPISYENFEKSMAKLERMYEHVQASVSNLPIKRITEAIAHLKTDYKNRFMVKMGDHIRSVPTSRIVLFYAEDRFVFLYSEDKRKYILDYKLEDLVDELDPSVFFRVNRSFILNINFISDVIVYSGSRLRIVSTIPFEKDIIVSREKVNSFKRWFNGL